MKDIWREGVGLSGNVHPTSFTLFPNVEFHVNFIIFHQLFCVCLAPTPHPLCGYAPVLMGLLPDT